MMKKIILLFSLCSLFSCNHKTENEGNKINQKVYVKSMYVASEKVDIDKWKVTIPYKARALEKNDFKVELSIPNENFNISPLPLNMSAGGSAKVVVNTRSSSQEVEITMRMNEHVVNFKKPQSGFLNIYDEEKNLISTGVTVSDGTLLTLSANPPSDVFVVDCYRINGKRLFWGKNSIQFEVKEDLNIEVFFTEKHKFSFVSVVEAGKYLVISKDKWLDYLDWEDYPDIYVEPFAIGRTEVVYPVWKEIRDWAKAHGYKFSNDGENGSHFVSTQDVKPFDETDGKLYPVVKINQLDMWAWCNALVDYMNEKRSSEADYVPLTYVYKFKDGTPLKNAFVDFPPFTVATPETYLKFQKVLDFVNSIVVDNNASGYRLPNRLEWIVAGRGGNPNDPAWNFKYPGSDNLDDVTFYHVKNSGKLKSMHPICSKLPNTLGLYDIVGNADEWLNTKVKTDPTRTEVIGNSSFDDKDEFGKYGWFQGGATGAPNPWGGTGTQGGGTRGYGATGFRLAFSLR
ncbi:MAG: SUMF1/EgtB/PvdO family nonheme iron enzyme [Treponema sp.]